jgi:hypothetical protein
MIVRWEVEDGYAGKSRPQRTEVDDEDYLDTPPDEREDFLYECIREDFDNKIGFYIQGTDDVPEDDGERWWNEDQ